MYHKILWGAGKKSTEFNFPKVDFIVDHRWKEYSIIKKVYLETHWRIMLKKPLNRVCFDISKLATVDSEKNDIIIGDIFHRESILPLAEKYGYELNHNLFDGFALSPEYCQKNKGVVTEEDIRKKDYEEDRLKCRIMASLIPRDVKSVCDLGSGDQELKRIIDHEIDYHGIDYIDKGQEYICNFDKDDFPSVDADCFFGCGILEFITNYKNFLNNITKRKPKYILMSYSVREFSQFDTFRSPVYHNCIYSNEIASIICCEGYELINFVRYESRQAIMLFKKCNPS